MNPPNVNLEPGSLNTAAVKQLQDWLVSNGYMTQDEVNTGYGTYGPRTTQAVLKVQQKLGVDNTTGPGYWGPRTMLAITNAGANSTQVKQPEAVSTATPDAPAQMSSQKALLSAIADVAQTAAATGKPPVSFAEALALAAKDPDIVAKYSDMAKLDAQSFTQQLEQAQSDYSSKSTQLKTQFENERKQLSENMAAAGTAYSGFRGKAQKDLAQSESGIVQSTRSQLKAGLNSLTSAFEAKYGTGATPNASVSFMDPMGGNVSLGGLNMPSPGNGSETITGQKAGDIVGTVKGAKTADINQSALNSYNATAFPAV